MVTTRDPTISKIGFVTTADEIFTTLSTIGMIVCLNCVKCCYYDIITV